LISLEVNILLGLEVTEPELDPTLPKLDEIPVTTLLEGNFLYELLPYELLPVPLLDSI